MFSVPSQPRHTPRPWRALASALLIATVAGTPAYAAETKNRRKLTAAPEPQIQTPISPPTVLVSLRKQRLRVFDGTREITSSRISSGKPGFSTPTGVFSILEKKVYHESNIYEGAPMPFMQRVTWSGIALHAGVVPGYPASHGCVRLPHAFSKTLFQLTSVGARVIITQDEASPIAFEHPALFKPLPENDPPAAISTHGSNPAEPRVASNDATAADRAALTTLVGAAAAAAAPAVAIAADAATQPPANDRPRSRTEANRRFAEKLANLETTLRTAEDKKKSASEAAKAAVRAAQDAEARFNEIRRPFEEVLRAAARAEAAREDAARAYRDFLNKTGLKEPPPRPSASKENKKRSARERERERALERERQEQAARNALSPEERELELEERLLDAIVDVKDTREGAKVAELAIGEAKAAFEKADAERKAAIDTVQAAIVDLRKAQTALIDGKAEAVRRARPLSVFISLKTQRLYIRQGFEPIFETPIEVDDPGTVGTHVFTAVGYDDSGDNFRWQLVTAQSPRLATAAAAEEESSRKKGKRKEPEGRSVGLTSAMATEAARAALDSIRIPHDVAEQITELAKPGTSLIISEKALSHETGKGTEFVVLTR